jgi:tRNA U34 2-thiouridine synthase MnmA/TrmU
VEKRGKVLVLLSGGLDSTLALNIMLEQGLEVEAVNFTTPFCLCDKCAVASAGERFGITIHSVSLGQEFLDVVAAPPHGHGSQMNPCIDCRILMLKRAKELAQRMGASFIVTGEVLNERPFSQRLDAMRLIEREAQLEGMILRPLSAKLLPETEMEKNGLIDREQLFSIQGRRRVPQMHLAKTWGIDDYPCPAGGCLLTDPHFAKRLRDFLRHHAVLTLGDVHLLKLGRHFRVNGCKVIVGRNETENDALLSVAQRENKAYMEVVDFMGPITILVGQRTGAVIKKAAEITVRYSDAPKDADVKVQYVGGDTSILTSHAVGDEELERFRIY